MQTSEEPYAKPNKKGLPTPPLPNYKAIHKIAIQSDGPSGAWSCGTYAMLAILHLMLSDKRPDQLPYNTISRNNMTSFHKALLHWYILGIPPDLWRLQCVSHEISSHPSPVLDVTWPCSIQAAVRLPRRPLYIPSHPIGHPNTQWGAPPTPWNPLLEKETIDPEDTNPAHEGPHNLISSSDDSDSDSDRQENTSLEQREPTTQNAPIPMDSASTTQHAPPPRHTEQSLDNHPPTHGIILPQPHEPRPPTQTEPRRKGNPPRQRTQQHPLPNQANRGLQKHRNKTAKRRATIRQKFLTNTRQHPLAKFWPDVIPQSMPTHPNPKSPLRELQPRNLHSMGWKPCTITPSQEEWPDMDPTASITPPSLSPQTSPTRGPNPMVSPHGPSKHKVEALHSRGLDPCLDPPLDHAPHQATPHTTNKSTRSTSQHHDTSTPHQADDDAGNNKGTAPTDTHPCNYNGHYPCDPTTTLKLATLLEDMVLLSVERCMDVV